MYALSLSKSKKFLTVSAVSSDSIVKVIIDDIINTTVKTAEVDEQKTKYLQHFINKHDTIGSFHSRVDNVINNYFNYTVTRHS
jgi:hypothetical protein